MPFLDLYIFKHGHWAISWGGIMILSDLMSHLSLFYSCKCWPTFSLRTSLILCACSLNLDRLSSSSRQRPCQATFNGMFEWKHFIELCFKDETSSKVPEALPASSVNHVAETLEQVNIIGTSVVGAWYFLLCMRHLVKRGWIPSSSSWPSPSTTLSKREWTPPTWTWTFDSHWVQSNAELQ